MFDNRDPIPELAPILRYKYPKSLFCWCQRPDAWYHGDFSSLPLYLDVFKSRRNGGFRRCKLDIASDLSGLSLTPITNISIRPQKLYERNDHSLSYRICGNRPMSFDTSTTVEASSYTGSGFGISPSCHNSNGTSTLHVVTLAKAPFFVYSFCPVSGRLVHPERRDEIIICNFL